MINLNQFGEIAKKLAYNPLGIIALFIVLCYAIACLLFVNSAATLNPSERLPIIWFIVLFPVIVLLVFAWLVSSHHTKLYAPRDFQDASTYLRTLGIDEQRRRIEAELAEVALPKNDLGHEAVNPHSEQDLRQKLVIGEDLVMRELQAEFKVSINRQVAVGKDRGFDGIFMKNGYTFFIEVKFLSSREQGRRIRETIHQVETYVSQMSWKHVRCILALVVTNEIDKSDTQKIVDKILSNSFPEFFSIRLYSFAELVKKYGLYGPDIDAR